MKQTKNINVGVRMTPRDKEKLDTISKYAQVNASAVIRGLIDKEYD